MAGNNFFNKYDFKLRHGGDLSIQIMSLSDAYQVITARSGWVAIERVKQQSDTDLEVVEYRLPGMSGVDVMKKIEDVTL
jgi:CheY-like chemotaxis protein